MNAQSTQSPPILRLPYDILYSVLLLVYSSADFFDKDQTLITMSLVCQTFRTAVIDSPFLWSTILFDDPPPFQRQRLWIERSRGAGLAIHLMQPYNIKQTAQLARFVRPYLPQWRSLSLSRWHVKSKAYRLFFDSLRHESAPMLEDLEAINFGSQYRWKFQPFSSGTPKLTKLFVAHCRLKADSPVLSHLTHLTIWHKSMEPRGGFSSTTHDLFAIFSQAPPTLEYLDIDIPRCKVLPNQQPLSRPFIFPSLQYLDLTRPERPDYIPLPWVLQTYSRILAPGLRDHTLDALTLQHIITQPEFPFPGLRRLVITHGNEWDSTDIEIPQSTFQSILSQLPQLQELTITCVSCFDHHILATLGLQLKRLNLHMTPWFTEKRSYSGLRGVIEARRILAQSRGSTDPLVGLLLINYELPDGEVAWLRDHLQSFEYHIPEEWQDY